VFNAVTNKSLMRLICHLVHFQNVYFRLKIVFYILFNIILFGPNCTYIDIVSDVFDHNELI
jgi:hypothetical protein